MSTNPKPCPFCAATDCAPFDLEGDVDPGRRHEIVCWNCLASVGAPTPSDAFAAWDRRAPVVVTDAMVEAVMRARRPLEDQDLVEYRKTASPRHHYEEAAGIWRDLTAALAASAAPEAKP